MKRFSWFLLVVLCILSTAANICWGSVHVPIDELLDDRWHFIIWHGRFPAALSAIFTGAALSTCGLLLQSYFRNPLAGPSILGITSGANLMIALATLGTGSWLGINIILHHDLLVLAALSGAMIVLLLLLIMGRRVRSQVTLLIIGILVSYLTSALITLLGYHASAQGIQQLLVWGMGDFSSVGMNGLPYYIITITLGLIASLLLIKPLNGWMQGEQYAQNLGINLHRTRLLLLCVTGFLAAVTTAWCGPIAFVGLSMPHVARLLFRTDDHGQLLPASMLLGSLCCSLCLSLSSMPDGGTLLPINALTPLFGVPVILYILLKKSI